VRYLVGFKQNRTGRVDPERPRQSSRDTSHEAMFRQRRWEYTLHYQKKIKKMR
jgi:hypothetical protein